MTSTAKPALLNKVGTAIINSTFSPTSKACKFCIFLFWFSKNFKGKLYNASQKCKFLIYRKRCNRAYQTQSTSESHYGCWSDCCPGLMLRGFIAIYCMIIDVMSNRLSKEGRVEIRDFDCVTLNYKPPRQGRNPKTGAKVMVLSKYVPHFNARKKA